MEPVMREEPDIDDMDDWTEDQLDANMGRLYRQVYGPLAEEWILNLLAEHRAKRQRLN